MSLTKVTRNYQITVPRDIREQANIEEGDKLIITMEDNEIKIKNLMKIHSKKHLEVGEMLRILSSTSEK